MKILTVTPYYWPAFTHGGPTFSLYHLNKALARKGLDITVYTTDLDLNDRVPVNKEINTEGVKITYFSFTNLFKFIAHSGWQFSLPLTRALKKNLNNFDLIYISTVWNYSTAAAAYYSRLYRKPYCIAPRGMLYPDLFYKKIWKKGIYYWLILGKAMKNTAAIHYTTEDESQKTHSFFSLKNRSMIIPNGIDLSEFSCLSDRGKLSARYLHLKDKKVILFLGRINWKKGLDILVDAFARLARDSDDVHLLIAGGDEERYSRRVKRWIRKHGMNYADYALNHKDSEEKARVTFTGMLIGEEKLEAFRGSDIFVLPSYSENFALSVVEAMASRLPVVISNKVGLYNEIKRNNAGIIVETNAESLYQGIKLLLDNSDLKEEIAINGRKLAEEQYGIDKVADQMIEAFTQIIK